MNEKTAKHERLRWRTGQLMDSLLWTFKQHYLAGSTYGKIGIFLDISTVILAGVLTYGLLWDAVSNDLMIAIAILSAVLSGTKTAGNPAKRSASHYADGSSFQDLFDEFRDYMIFDLADQGKSYEDKKKRYDELTQRRLELKDDVQDVSSIWYKIINWQIKRGRNLYHEIETSKETIDRLTAQAKRQA